MDGGRKSRKHKKKSSKNPRRDQLRTINKIFLLYIITYRMSSHGQKRPRELEKIYKVGEENPEDIEGETTRQPFVEENPEDIEGETIKNYLVSKYPKISESNNVCNNEVTMWRTSRPKTSETPREYHRPPDDIYDQYNKLWRVCSYNLQVMYKIIRFIRPDSIFYEKAREIKEELDEITEELNEYGMVDERSSPEYISKYTSEINKISFDIMDIIRDTQDIIEVVVNSYFRRKIKTIVLNLTPGPFTIEPEPSSNNNVLILLITTHGYHSTKKYPSILGIPDGIELCKTTLALPGNDVYSLNEKRGFFQNLYGDNIYKDELIQHELADNFKQTFTSISNTTKDLVLSEIIIRHHRTKRNKETPEFITWCDGVLNSTSKLMYNTRHGHYIKNKSFILTRAEARQADGLEFAISVLYDSSESLYDELLPDGSKKRRYLIDIAETFKGVSDEGVSDEDADEIEAEITLQELLNNLNKLKRWNKIGILDITCDEGNELPSLLSPDYSEIEINTFLGGRKIKRTINKRRIKKYKHTKRRKQTKKKSKRYTYKK
jgi:hypothetical protein